MLITPVVTKTDTPVVTKTDTPVVTKTDTPVVTKTDTPVVTKTDGSEGGGDTPHLVANPSFRVFAYAAQSFYHSVNRAAGVAPVLSPPITAKTFCYYWLEGQDLIYLKLHGYPGIPILYGDDNTPALDISSIVNATLGGVTIFAPTCHLRRSSLFNAFFYSGARYVIAGEGTNYAAVDQVAGADRLGLWLRRLMQWGFSTPLAFHIARYRVLLSTSQAARDTFGFKLYT